MEPAKLAALLGEPDGDARRNGFGYCHACLFLNPVDMTAPYWKAGWLRGEALPCGLHQASYDHLTATVVRRERNLEKLLKFISRRRRAQQRREALLGSPSHFPVFASGIRGHR